MTRPSAETFGRTAARYVLTETRRYAADFVFGMCDPVDDDRLLDVGAGPGTLIGLLEPYVDLAVATDLTSEMLEICRNRTEAGLAAQADAERLPFADAAFTLVTCGSVFHHLPDPATAVREAARVLASEGRFLLVDMAGPEHPTRRAARDEIERVRDPSHAGILAPSQVRAMLDAAGLEIRDEERQVEDKKDADWAAVTGADIEAVRKELWRSRPVAAGFQALRWEGDGFVFRRERAYYLAVKR